MKNEYEIVPLREYGPFFACPKCFNELTINFNGKKLESDSTADKYGDVRSTCACGAKLFAEWTKTIVMRAIQIQ